MPPRKTTPTTFDGWLGKLIDDETSTHGGRPVVAGWIGVSEQSVNRRARGEVPYLAREVEIIAFRANFSVADIVSRALMKYGGEDGLAKLVAEYGRDDPMSESSSTVPDNGPIRPEDNVTYLGHVKPPLDAAADNNPRTGPKD